MRSFVWKYAMSIHFPLTLSSRYTTCLDKPIFNQDWRVTSRTGSPLECLSCTFCVVHVHFDPKTNMEFQEDHCSCILSKSILLHPLCFIRSQQNLPGVLCPPPPRGTSWSLVAAVFRRRVPTCEAWGCRSKVASAAAVIVLSIVNTRYVLMGNRLGCFELRDVVFCFLSKTIISLHEVTNPITSTVHIKHPHSVVSNICTKPYFLGNV